jgi:hypothetical protein
VRLARIRPLFNLVLLIAIPVVVLVGINLLVAPAQVQVQSALDFQTLAPETSINVADYQLAYHNRSLDLRNTINQATANIVQGYDPAAVPPAYASLKIEHRTYLITRLTSNGNSGAYWFKVIRLDPDQGVDLTASDSNPNIGLSCSNPRLEGTALVFEISLHCASGAAVHDSSYQTYSVALQ